MDPGVIDGLEPGTLWTHRFRAFRVRIELASRYFVRCIREDTGAAHVEARALFRDRFTRWRALVPPDVRMLKSRFSMSLANLEHMHVFIVPDGRRFIARSADRTPQDARAPRRGSPPVPDEAIFIGTYMHPFPTDLFLADLDDVLAQIRYAGESAAAA